MRRGLFIFLYTITSTSYAQLLPRESNNFHFNYDSTIQRKNPIVFQLEAENGGMIPNNKEVKETFRHIYYSGVNLRMGWQTQGDNIYHRAHKYPVYGVGIYSSTFRKAEIGTPRAIYGFVSIPSRLESHRKWNFNYRIALGIASNFEPYDPIENPKNILIGSPENVYIDFGGQASYRLNSNWQLGMGLAFHHFSNGSIRQPNKGINLIPLTVSATYTPSKVQPYLVKAPLPKFKNEQRLMLTYAIGFKQFNPENRRQYFKSTLGAYYTQSLGYKWRFGLGGDLYYSDSGLHSEIAGDEKGKFTSLFSGGPAVYVDHVLTEGLFINATVGKYLHRNEFNGELRPYFLKLGVRYKFMNNLMAGVHIKAHKGKADYVEWTLGYALKTR